MQRSEWTTGTAATGFNWTDVTHLYIGNRAATVWEGGIAALTVAAGVSGTGATQAPGGVEIAEWHPEPPSSTYVDFYGNTWTIDGTPWRFTSVI